MNILVMYELLKSGLMELNPEDRKRIFDLLKKDFCIECGEKEPCFCSPAYDE